MLPVDTNLKQAYMNGTDDEQKFIQNLALFLSTFLKEHGHLLEKKVNALVSVLPFLQPGSIQIKSLLNAETCGNHPISRYSAN